MDSKTFSKAVLAIVKKKKKSGGGQCSVSADGLWPLMNLDNIIVQKPSILEIKR